MGSRTNHDQKALSVYNSKKIHLAASLDNVSLPDDFRVHLTDQYGDEIELPKVLQRVLHDTLIAVSEDQDVEIRHLPQLLTLRDTAAVLRLSEDEVAKLTNDGKIVFHQGNGRIRYERESVLHYKKQQRQQRRLLEEIAAAAEA